MNMEKPHREEFRKLLNKQEEERKALIGEAHDEALSIYGNEEKIEDNNSFYRKTLAIWEDRDAAKNIVNSMIDRGGPTIISPVDVDWEEVKTRDALGTDKASCGYTMNPDMVSFTDQDFERMEEEGKITVMYMKECIDKNLTEVAQYIVDTYGATYHIPGIEYVRYILENPEKPPASLNTDGSRYHFFGSVLFDRHSYFLVAERNGIEWKRVKEWAQNSRWGTNDRIVLIKK